MNEKLKKVIERIANKETLNKKPYRKLKIRNGFTLVDVEDFELLCQFSWYIDSEGYTAHGVRVPARETTNGKSKVARVRMHQFLLGQYRGFVTDHINGDRLDNRRRNLRVVSQGRNVRNIHRYYERQRRKNKRLYGVPLGDWELIAHFTKPEMS